MKIFETDTLECRCAKKAAMICQYAINNPLHVFFEDGNVHNAPMAFERTLNDTYRLQNGKPMYEFIREFLNEFEQLPQDRRLPVYRWYRKKAEYLRRRWVKKIRKHSLDPQDVQGSLSYQRFLGADGHIYVRTDAGVTLCQF